MSVRITDNSAEVLSALEKAYERGLEAIGLTAEAYAKKNLYPGHGFDTGRLRNSITHVTDGEYVYIGTNVEYAPYVEFGTSKMAPRPYLKPAATEHTKEYEFLMQESLKNA